MFNPFAWLDAVLLNVAQKFCDKAHRVTGLTKFTFEKWAVVLMVLFHWATYFFSPEAILIAPLSIFAIVGVIVIRGIERKEAEFLKNGKLSRPFFDMPVRVLIVILMGSLAVLNFVSTDFGNNMLSYGQFSYIMWAYFGACTPPPSSKSKMREWYEKVLTALNDSLKPEPALVPIPISNR